MHDGAGGSKDDRGALCVRQPGSQRGLGDEAVRGRRAGCCGRKLVRVLVRAAGAGGDAPAGKIEAALRFRDACVRVRFPEEKANARAAGGRRGGEQWNRRETIGSMIWTKAKFGGGRKRWTGGLAGVGSARAGAPRFADRPHDEDVQKGGIRQLSVRLGELIPLEGSRSKADVGIAGRLENSAPTGCGRPWTEGRSTGTGKRCTTRR
jgi:hypothetical protein